MPDTRVIHISDAPPGWESNPEFVYIGRAGRGHDGFWGNPHALRDESQRANVLTAYMGTLWAMLLTDLGVDDQPLHARLRALHGKTLVCFCKPKACHGDVLRFATDILYPYG